MVCFTWLCFRNDDGLVLPESAVSLGLPKEADLWLTSAVLLHEGRIHGLLIEDRTDRLFLCRPATRAEHDLGWGYESRGGEASAGDESRGPSGHLRDWRSQECGGDC